MYPVLLMSSIAASDATTFRFGADSPYRLFTGQGPFVTSCLEPFPSHPQPRPARPLQGRTPRLCFLRPTHHPRRQLFPRGQHPRLRCCILLHQPRRRERFGIVLAHIKDLTETRLLKIDAAVYTTDKQVFVRTSAIFLGCSSYTAGYAVPP
jgi:hypothetical protein